MMGKCEKSKKIGVIVIRSSIIRQLVLLGCAYIGANGVSLSCLPERRKKKSRIGEMEWKVYCQKNLRGIRQIARNGMIAMDRPARSLSEIRDHDKVVLG